MSKEHLFILYVGDDGQVLAEVAESRGWYVLLPHDELEALAMYTIYFPDVILLDIRSDFADDVHFHLHSVGAHPMLWLGDIRPTELLDRIAALLEERVPPALEVVG
jgi:CheY-like chemotaxis protein